MYWHKNQAINLNITCDSPEIRAFKQLIKNNQKNN